MLEYRLTRGPRATGDLKDDKGCGFRGPGESKVETDKRLIRDRIVLLQVRGGPLSNLLYFDDAQFQAPYPVHLDVNDHHR